MRTVLFGAGSLAETLINELSQISEIVAVADNDPQKHGSTLLGKPVIAPQDIRGYAPEQILVSCAYPIEIQRQLAKIGLQERIKHYPLPKPKQSPPIEGIRGAEIVASVKASSTENGSVFYDRRQALQLGNWARAYSNKPVEDFLHIGPRYSLGLELACALYHGWNSFSLEPLPEFPKSYSVEEHAHLLEELCIALQDPNTSNSHQVEILQEDGTNGSYRLGNCRITLNTGTLFENATIPKQSFDLCYSNAVLEHVSDIDGFFSNCFEALRPEGICIHQIDMRDHRNFEKPLNYLLYDEEEWGTCQANYLEFNQNRFRHSHYLNSIAKAGFEIVACHRETYKDRADLQKVRSAASTRFATLSDTDWETIGGLYIIRKTGLARAIHEEGK